ncbi:MAG: hypothetical protein ACTSO9_20075 [Candidatus Helarchaeota archaeon]
MRQNKFFGLFATSFLITLILTSISINYLSSPNYTQTISNFADFEITNSVWNGNIHQVDVVSTESTGASDYPAVAVDVFGNIHVVWRDLTDYGGSGTDYDIFYKFWNVTSRTWSGKISATDIVSTESSGTSTCPDIAVDIFGNVHVVWYDNTNYGGSGGDLDIFYKFWNATSGAWNMTEVISTESFSSSYYPSIAVDNSGNVHVAWRDYTDYGGAGSDSDIFYKFWNVTSGVWSGYINATDVVSTESTGDSFEPSLAVDSSGNVHIAWYDITDYNGAGIDWDIFYKFWNATSGAWNMTEVVSTESTGNSRTPSLAVDGSGNVHIAWSDTTDYSDAGSDSDIFYKFWNVTSGIWNGYVNATDVVSGDNTGNSQSPSLAVDDSGNVHVAWHDNMNYTGAGTDNDIFYTFWDANSRVWNVIEVISTESTGSSMDPAVAVNSSSSVHIVWYDGTDYGSSGADLDIFYKRNQPLSVSNPSNPLEFLILLLTTQETGLLDLLLFPLIITGIGVVVIITIIMIRNKK